MTGEDHLFGDAIIANLVTSQRGTVDGNRFVSLRNAGNGANFDEVGRQIGNVVGDGKDNGLFGSVMANNRAKMAFSTKNETVDRGVVADGVAFDQVKEGLIGQIRASNCSRETLHNQRH
ncbi:hypothetical protein D3C80_1602450 [compost metagenome]